MTAVHVAAAWGIEDLVIPQGADKSWIWEFGEGSPAVAPTGWASPRWGARMQVRPGYGAELVLLEVSSTTTPSLLTLDVTTGGLASLTLLLAADTTEPLAWRTGVYDIELTDSVTGRVIRLVEGKATLSPDATRG